MARKMMGCCSVWLSGLVVLVLMVSRLGNAEIECGNAIGKLLPCLGFLVGTGPAVPSDQCCGGAHYLDDIAAASQPDRKALCLCLKQTATFYPINFDRANLLPNVCKLKINITISPTVDCNAI